MATPSSPDPEERDPLSSWERRALADIEARLTTSDPPLAHRIAGRHRPLSRWWPISLRATALLVIMQAVLICAIALVPPSLEAVLGVVTVLVVVPWLALCAIENAWTSTD